MKKMPPNVKNGSNPLEREPKALFDRVARTDSAPAYYYEIVTVINLAS